MNRRVATGLRCRHIFIVNDWNKRLWFLCLLTINLMLLKTTMLQQTTKKIQHCLPNNSNFLRSNERVPTATFLLAYFSAGVVLSCRSLRGRCRAFWCGVFANMSRGVAECLRRGRRVRGHRRRCVQFHRHRLKRRGSSCTRRVKCTFNGHQLHVAANGCKN